MAGKNSVRIPVALELESEDIIKDYKATISKMSNIDDLQLQFKELLKLQKQYIDKANASVDPMTKALNLQGVKAYSEMLSRVQSQVNRIDKTKLADFTLPKLQFDDKEILNNVNNIDKAVKGIISDMESIGKSTGLGNLFKGIGSDSIKKFYQERIESSSDAVKYELKNNRLSIESIEKLLDTMQQYEIFNKKILKKSGTISTNVEDVLPKNLLKDENLFKNISLDELQVRWKKITTPDVVDNVRSAIIGNLSSRAMNKPLYIPTDGLIMNSEVANDFGAYQKKIDAAKLSLKEIGKEFVQLNENVDSAELSFKTKDGKDDIEQMNKYLDMAFKIKSAIQDVKSLSSAIGIGEKDSLKLSDFGLARFDTVFDDIMGKPNTAVIYKYLDQVEESITRSFNKAMGDVGDDSEKVLRTKLSQINQIITDGTKLSYINESNLSEELDATLGKENSLNLVLIQRQKIMSELVKKGYQLSEKELQANSATIQAEQIRKGYMPVFGPNGNVDSGSGDGNSNYSNDEIANLKKEYADITVEAEKYKQQITELTAKLQEYRTVSNQPDNFKAKLLATEQALEAAQQKITELNQKISDWKNRVEQEAIINSSGYTVHQSDYDALISTLEKVKAEAQNTKDELEQLKTTSVQLSEGEQVVKGGDSGTIKELGEAVKALQIRMNKAEEILKDVPEGMNGLKQLSGQIGKMSGNFNEDGSLKNLGKTSEELSEQFKALETKFEERLNQKIAEIEKKSYKEKSPNRKFNLAGSLKDLKVVVKSQNATPTSAADTAQKNTAIKTEGATQELYKETEAYKTLADAVEKYNTLTAQHLGENDFDARIKRLQDMQACVEKIIAGVENYEGKANELSSLTLQSKKGNISIQDSTKLDTLMSKLQAGVDKNVDRKNQFAQLEEEAKKFEAAVNEYDQKFQSIISQKVTSGKQFSVMKRSLQDMSNSLDAIMEKYDTFKGQGFYSSDFANRGEAIRGKVKDASLDLNEISKYKGFEEDILTIQAKYSESLKRQKQEQDTIVEAARKKAEAEKQASEAAKSNEAGTSTNMSVAEKSREEQKRKALERQAGINTDNASGFAGSSQKEIEAIGAIDKAVQELTQHIKDKNSAISDEVEAMKSASTAEINTLKTVQEQVSNIKGNLGGQITTSDNNTPVVPQTNSMGMAALTGEISETTKLKAAFESVTGVINAKTDAIKAEAVAMSEAAQSEVSDVDKIGNAVTELSNKISAIAQINISNANAETPITLHATVNDTQIATIREKIAIAFNENNPIPISFVPKIEGIREQINKAIGKAPIELKSSKTNNIFKIEKLTVSKKVVAELKRSIDEQLDSIKIKSFDFDKAAKNMKKTLSEAMSNVGLQFDTKKLRLDIKTAVNAARDAAESTGLRNPTITTSVNNKKNRKNNTDSQKFGRSYASLERDVTSYYSKNTMVSSDQNIDKMFSTILKDIKKAPRSKENLDSLYQRFFEAQIEAINKGLSGNADKFNIDEANLNRNYETLISQIKQYLEANTKLIGSSLEEEFAKLLAGARKGSQARTGVDLAQLKAEFARLMNDADTEGLSGNADNENKKILKLERGYAALSLEMKKFHEENNKFDANTEWLNKFNKIFDNVTGSISRSDIELEDFRTQFANFKNEIPRDLLGETVTSDFFENLKGYDIDSIAKVFEKQSGRVKSKLLGDRYGFESSQMSKDVIKMIDAQANRLGGLVNKGNVSDTDIDNIIQHNKEMNDLINTYQTYSEKRRELENIISKDSNNEELNKLLQEGNALSNSQNYDIQALKSWSDKYAETLKNLKEAQDSSQKEERSNKSTSAQQNKYRELTKDIKEALVVAEKFKAEYSGLLSNEINGEVNKAINDMSAWKDISIDISNSDDILVWNDESKKLLDTWEKIQERIQSSVVASGKIGEIYSVTMDYSQYTKKTNNALNSLSTKYKDKFNDEQTAEFEKRLEAIRDKIKEINSDTSKYDAGNINAIETDIQQLEKLAKEFVIVQESEDKIKSLMRDLSNAQNSISSRGSVAQPVVNNIENEKEALNNLLQQSRTLDFSNPEAVQEFINKLNEADVSVNKLKEDANQIKISDNAAASAEKLKAKFDDLIYKAQDFKNKNTKMNRDAGLTAQFNELIQAARTAERSTKSFNELNARFNALKSTVMSKGLTGRSLGDELGYIASKIGLKAMLGGSVYRVLSYFRQMVTVVKELDTGMTTLKRVTDETEATYGKFLNTAGDEAHELGSTISNLVNSTGDFARLGYNIQESSELAKNALMYSNVGWLDIQTATADMTSTMKAFNITAQDSVKIVDVFDILGNKYAVTAANIGEGLKESASALATANNSMEESAAMITAITEITQDASGAGNALKTNFMSLCIEICIMNTFNCW